MTSCGQATIQHPGAVNATDSNMYDALLTDQAAIEQAKTLVSQYPAIKDPLNKVIASFNTAQTSYKSVHAALVANTSDASTVAKLQADITALQTALSAVLQQAGVK